MEAKKLFTFLWDKNSASFKLCGSSRVEYSRLYTGILFLSLDGGYNYYFSVNLSYLAISNNN